MGVEECGAGVETDSHERDHARVQRCWTIIIPTRGGGARLNRTIASLLPALGEDDEVLVVRDNCEPERLAVRDARVRDVVWSGHRGFGTSCNHGAQEARGALLLFLNDDVVIRSEQTLRVLAAALSDVTVALVGPDVVSERLARSESGTSVLWQRGVLETQQQPLVGSGLVEVDYVCGAALAVRAATFRSLGGFDEKLAPYYWEDVSLALHARSRGLRAVVAADIKVVHAHGTTISLEDESKRRSVYERNRVLVTCEHLVGLRWLSFGFWTAVRFVRSRLGDGVVAQAIKAAAAVTSRGAEGHADRD